MTSKISSSWPCGRVFFKNGVVQHMSGEDRYMGTLAESPLAGSERLSSGPTHESYTSGKHM